MLSLGETPARARRWTARVSQLWPGIPCHRRKTSPNGSGMLKTCCGSIWNHAKPCQTPAVHQARAWPLSNFDFVYRKQSRTPSSVNARSRASCGSPYWQSGRMWLEIVKFSNLPRIIFKGCENSYNNLYCRFSEDWN